MTNSMWSGRRVDAEGAVCGFGLSGGRSTKKKLMELDGRKWNFERPRTPVPSFAVCWLWHH